MTTKTIREEKGMSIAQFSELTGISEAQIKYIEKERTREMYPEEIALVAEKLNDPCICMRECLDCAIGQLIFKNIGKVMSLPAVLEIVAEVIRRKEREACGGNAADTDSEEK